VNADSDKKALAFVRDLQTDLTTVLASLRDKQSSSPSDKYIYYCAKHINQTAGGYLLLRQSDKRYAGKLLVRTVLEAMFRLHAVRQKPALLFRIAYTEHEEDLKFVKAVAVTPDGPAQVAAVRKQWETVKAGLAPLFPKAEQQEDKLSAREAAQLAGMTTLYDSYYRVFCTFTHAALRATGGSLDSLEHLDDVAFASALLTALEAVISLGGESRDTASYRKQYAELTA
jgi:hypothetical protein